MNVSNPKYSNTAVLSSSIGMPVEIVLEFHVRTDAEEDGDELEMLEGGLTSEAKTLRLSRVRIQGLGQEDLSSLRH